MDNREAVNWLINISADIGKAEHSDLWHYEQALAEIKDMLESAQPEYEPVKAEDFAKTMSENTLYGFIAWHSRALELMEKQGFVICKKTM